MAHILVVDDEISIQFLIRTMLESVGHNVFEAQDGQAALDILETNPKSFDIIILDLLMPRMDGFDFLLVLQNQAFHPPVIILSTYSDGIQKLDHMIDGYLSKPFERQELVNTINHLLAVKD